MNFEPARAMMDLTLVGDHGWPPGTLAPRNWSEGRRRERWWLEAHCLLHRAHVIEGRLRFVRLIRRRVERADRPGRFVPVDALVFGGHQLASRCEGEVCEFPFCFALDPAASAVVPFLSVADRRIELVRNPAGGPAGRIIRVRDEVSGRILLAAEPAGTDLMRLRVRVECTSPWLHPAAPREQVVAAACLSTHLMLAARGGRFLSMQDPPAWAAEAAAECKSVGTHPVLVGARGTNDLLLCAPTPLPEHPRSPRRSRPSLPAGGTAPRTPVP